jgi:hyperosmotically inducible periplasmic protein
MKRHLLMLAGISIAGLVLACGAAAADDTPQHSNSLGAAVSDTATTAKVKERLADDKRLSDSKISVTTNNGVVTLTGSAPSADASNAAEEAAEGVSGVKSVDNQIAAPSKLHDVADKTAGKVTDDWITTRVKTELFTDRSVQGDSNISVTTANGVVHLRGTAASKQAYDQAKTVAENVKGVRSVDASGLHLASSQ